MKTHDDSFEQFLIRCEHGTLYSLPEAYQRLRVRLIKFFGFRSCEDPEALADETIGRLITNVYAGETIDQPLGYALGTARNVYLEYLRKRAKLSQIAEDDSVADQGHHSADSDLFEVCAQYCFQKLAHDKRRLLEQYYSEEGGREKLAGQEGVTLAGLRTKIHRLRIELKECYRECIRGRSG